MGKAFGGKPESQPRRGRGDAGEAEGCGRWAASGFRPLLLGSRGHALARHAQQLKAKAPATPLLLVKEILPAPGHVALSAGTEGRLPGLLAAMRGCCGFSRGT